MPQQLLNPANIQIDPRRVRAPQPRPMPGLLDAVTRQRPVAPLPETVERSTVKPWFADLMQITGDAVGGFLDPEGSAMSDGQMSKSRFLGSLLGAGTGAIGMAGLPPGMFSRLQRAVQSIPSRNVHPNKLKQMVSSLANPQEAEFTGLTKLIEQADGRPMVTADVQKYVQDNPLSVGERVYGGSPVSQAELDELAQLDELGPHAGPTAQRYRDLLTKVADQETHHERYVIPGGRDYQERVMTWDGPFSGSQQSEQEALNNAMMGTPAPTSTNPSLPANPNFSNHAFSEPNAIGWSRSDIRDTPEGPFLHTDEWQSDIHQKGTQSGYKRGLPEHQNFTSYARERGASDEDVQRMWYSDDPMFTEWKALQDDIVSDGGRVPNVPFKDNTWMDALFKRDLMQAVEQDLAGISWNPGAVHQTRWGNSGGNPQLYDAVAPKRIGKIVGPFGGKVEPVGVTDRKNAIHLGPEYVNADVEAMAQEVSDLQNQYLLATNEPGFVGSQPAKDIINRMNQLIKAQRAQDDASQILGVRFTPEFKAKIKEHIKKYGISALTPLLAATLGSQQEQ